MVGINSTENRAPNHLLFLFVTYSFWFSQYVYIPILAPYLEYRGATYVQIGLILSSYGLLQFILRWPLGVASDLFKLRYPFIILGLVAAAVSAFGFALTTGQSWFMLWRGLAGVSASTWVAFTVLYMAYYPREEATKAMGVIQFVTVFAQLCGMMLSGWLVQFFGWPAAFIFGGVVAVFGLCLAFRLERVQEQMREQVKLSELIAVAKERRLLKLSLLSVMAHSILFITIFGYLPSYTLSLGSTEGELSYLVVSFMVPHALSSLVAVKIIVARLGQWNTLISGFLACALANLLIPAFDHLVWLCITQVLNGFALGLLFPLILAMVSQGKPEKQASAMGFYQSVYALGIFSGPFLAGHSNSLYGLVSGFMLSACLGGIAALLSMFWRRKS